MTRPRMYSAALSCVSVVMVFAWKAPETPITNKMPADNGNDLERPNAAMSASHITPVRRGPLSQPERSLRA